METSAYMPEVLKCQIAINLMPILAKGLFDNLQIKAWYSRLY